MLCVCVCVRGGGVWSAGLLFGQHIVLHTMYMSSHISVCDLDYSAAKWHSVLRNPFL